VTRTPFRSKQTSGVKKGEKNTAEGSKKREAVRPEKGPKEKIEQKGKAQSFELGHGARAEGRSAPGPSYGWPKEFAESSNLVGDGQKKEPSRNVWAQTGKKRGAGGTEKQSGESPDAIHLTLNKQGRGATKKSREAELKGTTQEVSNTAIGKSGQTPHDVGESSKKENNKNTGDEELRHRITGLTGSKRVGGVIEGGESNCPTQNWGGGYEKRKESKLRR